MFQDCFIKIREDESYFVSVLHINKNNISYVETQAIFWQESPLVQS